MNNIIKIKCPGCGSILPIMNQPDLDKKFVTCPTCKLKSHVAICERVVEKKDEDDTEYNYRQKKGDDDTVLGDRPILSMGRLVDVQTGKIYHLKLGKNTIGRKVSNPLPSVSIPIDEVQSHNTMSREHAVIEVTRLGDDSYRHFLYNWNNKNGTYINGSPVEKGERFVLCHGQTIKMGQVLLRFEFDKKKRMMIQLFKNDIN